MEHGQLVGSTVALQRCRLSAVAATVRGRQWPQQALLLLALVYVGAFTPGAAEGGATGVAVFFLLSGAIYFVIGVGDRERDRKRYRRLVCGALSLPGAWVLGATSSVVVAALRGVLGWAFRAVATLYAANCLLYTHAMKLVALRDVLHGVGFVLRAWTGAAATHVPIGPWLLACAGSGAVFIGMGERHREIAAAGAQRRTLRGLETGLSDELATASAALTMVLYTLACLDSSPTRRGHALLLTPPVVTYGVMRGPCCAARGI